MSAAPLNISQADRSRFPGMIPAEIAVWKRWLALHEKEYDRYEYNVRLGPGVDPGPQYPEWVRKSAIDNSKFRPDVIAYKDEDATVFEVKVDAGSDALGQLLNYSRLLRVSKTQSISIKIALVFESINPSLVSFFNSFGVELFKV
jgi:hypothetical protein